MHCFIPHTQYSDDIHMRIVSLMRGELVKNGCDENDIGVVTGKDGPGGGYHFFAYLESERKDGHIVFDVEEPISIIILRCSGDSNSTIP